MSWRTTPNGRYYYRWRKQEGRTKAAYFGSGKAATEAAQEDADRAQARVADRQRAAVLRISWEALQQEIAEFKRNIRGLFHVVQWQRGYYSHHRQWRNRRVRRQKP